MNCSQCGSEIPEGSHFCTNCGALAAAPAETAQAPPPTPPPPPVPPVQPPPQAQQLPPPPAAPSPPPRPGPAASGTPPAKKSRGALWAVIASLAALLIIAVVVVVVAFVVVSSDTGKARDLMISSDALIDSVSSRGDTLGEALQSLLEDLASGNIETTGDFEDRADDIRGDLEDIRSDLDDAKEGYGDILELDGVEDHEVYAKKVLKLIDVFQEHAEVIEVYLDYLSGELAKEAAGESVDSDEVARVTSAFVEKTAELNSQEEELAKEAKEIKREKKL